MKEVWVLNFECVDFHDCNGVFSTKEKAIKAFKSHCERCEKNWSNPMILEEDDDWVLLEFCYQDNYTEKEQQLCFITKYEIDKI